MKFRSWMLVAALSLSTNWAAQADSLNDGGYVGCLTEEYLDQFISAAVKSDNNGMTYLLKQAVCAPLSSQYEISVLENGFSTVKIRVYVEGNAVELWTVREAISRD
jgi:hypothetical protein